MRSRPKLIPDREYLFTHKRKRTFRAVFKRFVRAPATDTLDEYYYECEVDSSLSGNPWHNGEDEEKVPILVRPSLVTLIQSAQIGADHPHLTIPGARQPSSPPLKENWVAECMHTLRSVFRGRKRT